MTAFWDSLHFMRPYWLWALLVLPAAALGARARQRRDWRRAIDPHLLAVLQVGAGRAGIWPALAAVVGLLLAVLALAGPSWRQLEQPLAVSRAPLVLVLDLSSASLAPDLAPSRLLQARAKLAALLHLRQGGEVGLVAYAGEPFTVAPLTDDAANVALFLDALEPEIMPLDGQRTDKALQWAGALLRQSGAGNGDVLLLGDHADPAAIEQAARLREAGHRVSALGLGTAQGAAYRDRDGGVAEARLDAASLQALAAAGGGGYARLSAGDEDDLRSLGVLRPAAARQQAPGGHARGWQDEGYWLLPPLMLLALLAFRPRRFVPLLALLGLCLPLAWPLPVQAAEAGGWWWRPEQRDHQRLTAGVAAYRQGDYAGAQRRFEGIDTAQGWYNLGNALARQGHYDAAIDAYDQALGRQPGMADATANRAAVEAARQRRPPPQDGDGQSGAGRQDPGAAAGQPRDPGQATAPPRQAQGGRPPPRGQEPAPTPRDGQAAAEARQEVPAAADAPAQQQADLAQRARMAEAMRRQPGEATGGAADAPSPPEAGQRERQQALDGWMQRVPDAPGDLLKAKFQLEYQRRRREQP
ncbi:VWA domain-containing protein [Stenotrophomonas mori]|uniref:VWA domain-containing protein n=1 Tax=Stenotrophomonas mori TaxID=2871096 RepID=A0ABT0SCS6_9GAMM|nr:VWA domain-containing protein [Stenotrophomonas mori]MCL7713123.1 VWA domain-containing protein [Stenotrophomonas mori]